MQRITHSPSRSGSRLQRAQTARSLLQSITCAFTLIALAGCATLGNSLQPDAPVSQVPPAVAAQLEAAAIPLDALGGVVLDGQSGRILWQHNAKRAMQPASTIKVLTSIVALETLKPSYRARTELATRAPQRGPVLAGDLYLVGYGADEFSVEQLESMLRRLRAQGIERIEGDLILDREFFQPPRTYEGAAPFDESPEFRYNVIPDALMLGSNLHQLAIASNETELRIVAHPPMARVEFVSEMKLVEKPCERWEDDWKIPRVERAGAEQSDTIRVVLHGEFPARCAINTELNLLNRTDYAERVFAAAWRALGGEWLGRAIEGKRSVSADVRVLASQDSRTLAEINRDINKRSDNPFTRTAFLSLAATRDAADRAKFATTFSHAERIVRDWMKSKSIDDASLVLENGSGLSRTERISPLALAQVLRAASQSVWSHEFMMSLPIVGVDGAMRNRLKDTRAAEIGRMKTGGLRNVVSVAGYLPDANNATTGKMNIVVLFLNHDNVSNGRGRAALDTLMKSLLQL